MKMTHIATCILLAITTVPVVHAEDEPGGAAPPTFQMKRKALAPDTVQFTDKKISKQVLIESVYAERTATGTARITVRFINKTKRMIQLEGRSLFMDADRKPVEAISAWKTVYLPPKSFGVYEGLSAAADGAEHFLIEVRGTDRS